MPGEIYVTKRASATEVVKALWVKFRLLIWFPWPFAKVASINLATICCMHPRLPAYKKTLTQTKSRKWTKNILYAQLIFTQIFYLIFSFYFIIKNASGQLLSYDCLRYSYIVYIFFCNNISICSGKVLRYWFFQLQLTDWAGFYH